MELRGSARSPARVLFGFCSGSGLLPVRLHSLWDSESVEQLHKRHKEDRDPERELREFERIRTLRANPGPSLVSSSAHVDVRVPGLHTDLLRV